MPTGRQRVAMVLRAGAASYWTAFAAFVVMTALHLRWLHRSAHASDVLPAYGAGLVALGVLVGSRPYLRAGFAGLVQAGLPAYGGGFYDGEPLLRAHRERVEAERPRVVLDVLAERVVAVAVVLIGTLLNGWGTPLARRWGWPV